MTFPQTILMMIVSALPLVLLYQYTQIFPLVLMYGFTAPAYFCAWLYSRTFKRLEPKAIESAEEGNDVQDETAQDDISQMMEKAEDSAE